jgi:hypothetical protein
MSLVDLKLIVSTPQQPKYKLLNFFWLVKSRYVRQTPKSSYR